MLIVAGYCPMGCGPVLALGEGGSVVCASPGCPRPSAVTEMLADPETEHVVMVDSGGLTVKHPLRERLGDQLLTCRALEYLHNPGLLPLPPPGRYRVMVHDDGVDWFPRLV
jgi:hypothetical protein